MTPPAEVERLVRASAVAAQPALAALSLPLLIKIKEWGLDKPLPTLWEQSGVVRAPRRAFAISEVRGTVSRAGVYGQIT
ncbi:MAG: hypothetical protein EPN31_16170 [Castellaniella sp.]|uniref:hypothetical protein n=1 Tax=Castellaniella sp. TaxID=1955812 RepID=UPI00121462DA|nr:hypothetical protein [Castellaniella sp.]TAN25073.1 MAG: hypothetical protein EPN31_16170 [Castellaniella sp.]